MVQTRIPASEARARVLLEHAATWARGVRRSDGLAFVVFASSRPGVVYFASERGCTCKGYLYRGSCAHVIAIRTEAARARASVGPRASLDALLDNHLCDAF